MENDSLDRVTLGRTGLEVTVAGLGCGGHSKLGLVQGRSQENAVAVVEHALDLGINIIDSSETYGTEDAVGKAVSGHRDEVVIATKVTPRGKAGLKTPDEIVASLEGSLKRLGTDRIDIYQVHAVGAGDYDAVVRDIYPVLIRLREEGKIRFIGITEMFGDDNSHAMLNRATADGIWDTIMVGFNILNPSARGIILPQALANNIGVFCMFAVRKALTSVESLRGYTNDLLDRGLVSPSLLDRERPLSFLTEDSVATTLAEASYRFCRHEPGVHCVLSGTGSTAHLDENVRSLTMPALPAEYQLRLAEIFGHLDCVTGG